MYDLMILISRLMLGVPFIISGYLKLRPGGSEHLVPVLAGLGLPQPKFLASMVGVCELVGGVGVAIGWPVTLFGILLGLWCLLTAYVAHRSDINSVNSHVTMAGGFFLLATVGPGAYALF